MWKVYKYDGSYIMGTLISKHSTEGAEMIMNSENEAE